MIRGIVFCLGVISFSASALVCADHLDHRKQADRNPARIERRIKILTDGTRRGFQSEFVTDSPDPSGILRIRMPYGKSRYRIGFTGMHYIEAAKPADFFRGGIFPIKRARGFYEDGTEMVAKYDGSAWPWDVVEYPNAADQLVAFGGVMPQPAAGQLPELDLNHRRSRWWGEVEWVRGPKHWEEHIRWRQPLHDFNLDARKSIWEGHGYGGTLLTKFDPKLGYAHPVRLENGNFLLFYERVTEERQLPDGARLPWVTTMFSRELDPSLMKAVGPEYPSSNLISPKSGTYFRATGRGVDGERGYLAEGGNVLSAHEGHLIKSWSASDFTGRYGIFLDYLPPSADPRGVFKPVVDADGELIDFADTLNLRQVMNGTWIGRPLLEYDPDGKLWLRFHYVPIEGLPDGAPLEGWPPREYWGSYPRFAAQIPVRLDFDSEGVPRLEWDLDPEFAGEINSYR